MAARRGVAVALAALMLALGGLGQGPARSAAAVDCADGDLVCQDLNSARSDSAGAAAQLAAIQRSISDTNARITALASLLVQLDTQLRQQQATIDQTQGQIDETDRRLRLTEAEVARQQAHITIREQLLNQRVRAMDKHGSVNYFELVLTSTSFNQLVDRVIIMQDIVRSDQQLIVSLRAERDQLTRLQKDLATQRSTLDGLLATQRSQQAQLQSTRATQAGALALQQQYASDLDQQRAQIEAEKRRIDALVVTLQAAYDAEATGAGGGTGLFGWPIASRLITQGYVCSTLLGEPYDPSCPTRHRHYGIDIAGPYGTSIYAADNGVVSYVNSNGFGGGYGNYIIITHGNGYATLYAHLSAVRVAVGQRVARGMTIGAEGSTGYSTGPHLHFEIRYNGAYQNPCAYLGC